MCQYLSCRTRVKSMAALWWHREQLIWFRDIHVSGQGAAGDGVLLACAGIREHRPRARDLP